MRVGYRRRCCCQVIQEISRRTSISQVISSLTKTLSQDNNDAETASCKVPTSTSLPSRRHFLNPSEGNEGGSAMTQNDAKEEKCRQRRRQLRRSNTEIEMTTHATLSNFIHKWKKIPGSGPDSSLKGKKDLEKMWQNTYIGMCNRAVVLNHAILKAEREEATVKPVSLLDVQAGCVR